MGPLLHSKLGEVIVLLVVLVTGGKQSQLLALTLGLGWSLTKIQLKTNFFMYTIQTYSK